MRPAFIFTADSHLQQCQWVSRPKLCGDAIAGFRAVREAAQALNIPTVHGGDLFDTKRPHSVDVREYLSAVVDTGGANGPPLYFVQGDHDYATPPWAALCPWARPLDRQLCSVGGFKLFGLDFAPRGQIQSQLAEVPSDADILVTHLGWSHLQGIGKTNADPQDVHHVRYVLTGDYHAQRQCSAPNAQGELVAYYSPGSTVMTKIDEMSPRGYLVCGEGEHGFEAQFHAIPNQRLARAYQVSSADELDAIVGRKLPELLREAGNSTKPLAPIARITYRDDIPEVRSRLAVFEDDVHLFLDPRASLETIEVDTSHEAAFATLTTAIDTLAKDDPQLRADTRRLLEAADRGKTYDDMRAEHDQGVQSR